MGEADWPEKCHGMGAEKGLYRKCVFSVKNYCSFGRNMCNFKSYVHWRWYALWTDWVGYCLMRRLHRNSDPKRYSDERACLDTEDEGAFSSRRTEKAHYNA